MADHSQMGTRRIALLVEFETVVAVAAAVAGTLVQIVAEIGPAAVVARAHRNFHLSLMALRIDCSEQLLRRILQTANVAAVLVDRHRVT